MKIVILVGCLLFGISCSHPKKCHHRSFFKSITDSTLYDSIKYDDIYIATCGELIGSKYYYKFGTLSLFWDTSLYIRKQGKQYYLLSKNEYLKTHHINEHLFLDFSRKKRASWLIPEYNRLEGINLNVVFDSIWHNPDFSKIEIDIDSISPIEKKEWLYKGDLYCFSLYPHSYDCGYIYATENDIEYMRFSSQGSYTGFSKFRPKFKHWSTNKFTY